jgi:hypothetical protein
MPPPYRFLHDKSASVNYCPYQSHMLCPHNLLVLIATIIGEQFHNLYVQELDIPAAR